MKGERVTNIFGDGQMWIERKTLRHIANLPVGRRQPRYVLASEPDRPRIRIFESDDQAAENRLARFWWATDNCEALFADIEVEAVDRGITPIAFC